MVSGERDNEELGKYVKWAEAALGDLGGKISDECGTQKHLRETLKEVREEFKQYQARERFANLAAGISIPVTLAATYGAYVKGKKAYGWYIQANSMPMTGATAFREKLRNEALEMAGIEGALSLGFFLIGAALPCLFLRIGRRQRRLANERQRQMGELESEIVKYDRIIDANEQALARELKEGAERLHTNDKTEHNS